MPTGVPLPGEPAAVPVPPPAHHFLVQAPVAAVDADGLQLVTVGTIVFAIAALVTGLFYAELQARDNGWWLGVAISGFVLGLVGLAYCWNRRSRRRAGLWTKD